MPIPGAEVNHGNDVRIVRFYNAAPQGDGTLQRGASQSLCLGRATKEKQSGSHDPIDTY